MAAEQGIVALLAAASTLAGPRIRPQRLDRDPVLPQIVYRRVSTPRRVEHDGDQGYADFRTQLDCWIEEGRYDDLVTLASQIRAALHGYRGTAGGVEFGLIAVSGDRDGTNPDRHLLRMTLDAHGNYRET